MSGPKSTRLRGLDALVASLRAAGISPKARTSYIREILQNRDTPEFRQVLLDHFGTAIAAEILASKTLLEFASRREDSATPNPTSAASPETPKSIKVADTIEVIRTRTTKMQNDDRAIIEETMALEKKHTASGQWDKLVTLAHDLTMAGIYPDRSLVDQPHPRKTKDGELADVAAEAWMKEQHPDLARRWAELDPELQQFWKKADEYYRNRRNAMALGVIKNHILRALGIHFDDPQAKREIKALAERIHEGKDKVTYADRDLLGDRTMDMVLEAKELSAVKAPYVPLMRRILSH